MSYYYYCFYEGKYSVEVEAEVLPTLHIIEIQQIFYRDDTDKKT